MAFKLDPQAIPDLPAPRPKFEIFVYSPRFEGVHLRFGAVARGGLRWSDRREDFRTEVLGLVKAQMVKNAVIVPVGAKGGFVLKQTRRATADEAGAPATSSSSRRLLDVTDNLVGGKVVAAAPTWSGTTATTRTWWSPRTRAPPRSPTSPTRSRVAYGFWLGDAFASGGSAGYDHKKMGITARGAWESVKRHFRELGVDTQTTRTSPWSASATCPATCSATGCCSREHIRLVAAFDHRHIFVDPDPDAATSYRGAAPAVRPAPLVLGRLRPVADLAPAAASARARRSRSRSRREARAALGIAGDVTALTPDRADAGDPAGAGRPALERRHRHLRQGHHRVARRRRRQGQRRDPGQRRASCAPRWSARAATWA